MTLVTLRKPREHELAKVDHNRQALGMPNPLRDKTEGTYRWGGGAGRHLRPRLVQSLESKSGKQKTKKLYSRGTPLMKAHNIYIYIFHLIYYLRITVALAPSILHVGVTGPATARVGRFGI